MEWIIAASVAGIVIGAVVARWWVFRNEEWPCGKSHHRFEARFDGYIHSDSCRYVRDVCVDCGETIERVEAQPQVTISTPQWSYTNAEPSPTQSVES